MNTVAFTDPLQRAWRRMTGMLFAPFEFTRWLVLGFSAWLATLGEGGYSFSFDLPSGNRDSGCHMAPYLEGFVREHLALVIALAIIAAVLLILVGLAVLWVSSQGRFVFLSNVATGRAEIVNPWKSYLRQGHSLFLWRLCFGLVLMALSLVIVGVGLAMAWPSFQARTFQWQAVAGLALAGLLFIPLGVAAAYVSLFLNHFVTPLMYKHRVTATAAWRLFLGILKPHFASFVLFGLLVLGLHLAVWFVALVVSVLTCCCAAILLALPYVGAVLLLPASVLFRALSLEFLRPFGAAFDVFPAPPPVPGGVEGNESLS